MFTGYLIFDALIANGDRHDRNGQCSCGPRASPDETPCAAPMTMPAVSASHFRTANGTVATWVRRGYARQFEHRSGERRQNLVDLARVAADLCRPNVHEHWLHAVLSVDPGVVRSILNAAPGLSDVTRDFTQEFVMINQSRLSDALS